MHIPVLTYHGMNIGGLDYAHNDHVALDSDLRAIRKRGKRIIPLNELVDWLEGKLPDEAVSGAVALTTDDGSWFDFYDLDHPSCGRQRSMFNILQDHDRPEWLVHMTSFVIASPDARSSLDRSCMIGKGWWGDEWWREAASSRVMDIANHSWDHVHPELECVAQRDQVKGDFSKIDCFDDAEAQIVQAGRYISEVTGRDAPSLFAYPWGDAGDYLTSDYLPRNRARHGLRAAFTIDPRPVGKDDSPWLLPRFVCGRDWDSPEGLDRIMRDSGV
jgi:peptidoglycan/xylan/chitin deacetylase (PgdA/CDA1 family)